MYWQTGEKYILHDHKTSFYIGLFVFKFIQPQILRNKGVRVLNDVLRFRKIEE